MLRCFFLLIENAGPSFLLCVCVIVGFSIMGRMRVLEEEGGGVLNV